MDARPERQVGVMLKWSKCEAGWYRLDNEETDGGVALAAVCFEGHGWYVYIDEDMPPGDSQHKTLREAKAEAERRVRDGK